MSFPDPFPFSVFGRRQFTTFQPDAFYDLTTVGPLPVDLAEIKACLKLAPSVTVEDDYLTALLNASTQIVEKSLHSRQIRANGWEMFLDEFPCRIFLRRDPVSAVSEIARLVSSVWTVVDSSTYYLKRSTQFSEVLLFPTESWPTDQDQVEHAVRVTFATVAHDCLAIAQVAIKRHVTFMFENRGDCDPPSATNSFEASGAAGVLATLTIKLV